MPDADPFPKVKRAIIRTLVESLTHHGFTQFRSTTYFVRDRGSIRDVFFFQKMRSNAVAFAYGVTQRPDEPEDDWSPGIPNARWLNNQEFYRCKYVDHVAASIGRAIQDLESEALTWYTTIQTDDDLERAIART